MSAFAMGMHIISASMHVFFPVLIFELEYRTFGTAKDVGQAIETSCVHVSYFRVLNTDNMSIIGLTIDYGPFGFMDRYEPGHICNRSGK